MENNKILEFKKVIANVKEIFWKYQIYQIKLQGDSFLGNKISSEQRETYQKYINCVNLILENMNHEYSDIINQIFIEKKEREDLNYSTSAFYVKVKKAATEFLNFVNYDSCQ